MQDGPRTEFLVIEVVGRSGDCGTQVFEDQSSFVEDDEYRENTNWNVEKGLAGRFKV